MNILYLTHRLPYAPNRGDRIRAFHMLREMSRFAEVSLFSFVHDDDEAERVGDIPFARHIRLSRVRRIRNLTRCIAALPTMHPLTHVMLDAPDVRDNLSELVTRNRPDLVVAYCSGMARLALEPPLRELPFVIDMVDVDSEKWARLSVDHRGPRAWVYEREARTLRVFEKDAARRAKATLVVNEREREVMQEIAPATGVSVVPNGVDLDAFRPSAAPADSSTVVFCGVMDYPPNEAGVRWFVQNVWPQVQARRPDARFVVVGSNPGPGLRSLASNDRSVRFTGTVDAVQPYLWDAAVSVAPLQVARGVQNKVLEALAAGLPAVVTPAVAAGLPTEVIGGYDIAESAAGFAEAVLALLASPPQSRRDRANSAAIDGLGWRQRLEPLEGMLQRAVIPPERHPSANGFSRL